MISERTLAHRYTSFWNQLAPMAERFVRECNVSSDEWKPPLLSGTRPDRRGLINETAFNFFANAVAGVKGGTTEAQDKAKEKIAQLERKDLGAIASLDEVEVREAEALSNRLMAYVQEMHAAAVPRPMFPGCGVLDDTEGDILAGTTLIEVKAGQRNFRVVDWRQLLVYASMNWLSSSYSVDRIGVVNPRQGTAFVADVDEICEGMCGLSASEVYDRIVKFISMELTSR